MSGASPLASLSASMPSNWGIEKSERITSGANSRSPRMKSFSLSTMRWLTRRPARLISRISSSASAATSSASSTRRVGTVLDVIGAALGGGIPILLAGQPQLDVGGAIAQLHPLCRASPQKTHDLAVDEGHLPQVQDDLAPAAFDFSLQLRYVSRLHPAAQPENRVTRM